MSSEEASTSADQRELRQDDIQKTYRSLRIGIVLSVFVLFASIFLEWSKSHCWQSSISAYYYTPVRAVLVGSLFAVGLALIVYKGQDPREDFCLNLAGMFVMRSSQ